MNTLATVLSWQTLAGNFYLADFFDVLVITLFIYAGLIFFKQTRSIPVLVGIGMVVVLYGLAQIFNLYLTALLLRSFFGVFLVVLVVLFREELRRFFEFIAYIGTRERLVRTSTNSFDAAIAALVQAIGSLAHRQIGALMVLSGNENLQRHIEGGIMLDGLLSQELLESIFDPTSPGHDGAIIMHKNRISMLSVHLPLSRNFKQIGKHGTRHAAALGITERSDALAVIISEERGTISLARGGMLSPVAHMSDLEEILGAYFHEKFSVQAATWWENIFVKNLFEKILAVCIAGLFWFFLVYQAGSVQRDFVVPISYRNLDDQLVVEETRPRTVTITLESRGKSFEQLDPSSIEVALDAGNFTIGSRDITITEHMVRRPINLSVINIKPEIIRVRVEGVPPPLEELAKPIKSKRSQ